MTEMVFLRDDLVCTTRVGTMKLGLVKQVGGCENSDDSSDSDSDDTTEEVNKGYVRVQWVPSGKNDIVPEDSVQVLDRSFLPRDVVRTKDSQQLGTVLSTCVTSNVSVAGTRKILKGVNVSDFRPLVPFDVDEIVAYGPWIGRIQDSKARIILKLNNGSRIAVDSESFDECGSLVWPKLDADAEEPYPGQLLSARGKFFKDVEWISGDKINFRMKNWYKMVVEQIEIVSLQIKWGARAFTGNEDDNNLEDVQNVEDNSEFMKGSSVDVDEGSYVDAVSDITENNPATPPPAIIDRDNLKKLRPLNHFWEGHVWVMDKFRYRINTFQASKLNQQKTVADKTASKRRLKKRMQKIFQHSTSEEAILKSQKKGLSDSEIDCSSDDVKSDQGDISTDGDDEDSDFEDLHCDIAPSSGAYISVETSDNAIDILVNNDSDLKITSPIGQFPTILGTMSCRFAECELDFTLTQKGDGDERKILLCNIQYPGHSEDIIAEMGKQFQKFMKSALKKVCLLSSLSTASLMALCPQAVRSFVIQHPSIAVADIYFEYSVDCRRTSGVIDKDGNKTEIEFEGDADDYSGLNQVVQMMNEVSGDDEELAHGGTYASPARQQTGRNVKFLDEQWITVEIRETSTSLKVQWQDGTVQNNIKAKDLFPAHHVDDNDFCPGDFVIDKRVNADGVGNDRYGVVLRMDNKNRMAEVKWMKSGKPDVVEEVSSYEIADSEEMQYRISDIVARTGNLHPSQLKGEHHSNAVGELLRVNEDGMLQVLWTDGTISLVHPLDVNNVSRGDEDNSIFASSYSEEDGSWTTASSGDVDSDSDSEVIGDAHYHDSAQSENDASDHERDRGEGVAQHQDTETSNETEDGSASLSNDDAQMAVSVFVDDIIESITYQLTRDELISDESTGACAFYMHSSAPVTHYFVQRHFDASSSKNFIKAFQRDLTLLRSSLPLGITVKAYEDRMDLLSVLVEGPSRTPYENGLFAFHIHLSNSYPESPPSVHYISYSPRLNPNLYETGRVCVSLLGTWSGKGNEVWTKDSTILQVLLSIQGLILNSEPYYNEAGYESHRGSSEGATNSRCYNEMVTLRLVQHMTSLIASPPEEFDREVNEYCAKHIPLLITRVRNMFEQSQIIDSSTVSEACRDLSFPLLPLSKGVTLSLQNRLTELESAFEEKRTE